MIKEHIEAIRQEFKERFGVIADIDIRVHETINLIDFNKAMDIVCGIQPDIEAVIEPRQSEHYTWLICQNNTSREQRVELTVWYKKES